MKEPKYMNTFKCIGGICEDNCCIGWDVDIDKKTFNKYQKVEHPLMKRELRRYVKINPEVYSDEINYAFAVLTEEKWCSFLNADRLCMIHKHLGESFLSNVCCEFPRITNKIDGAFERSATPSCPEVMRLLSEDPHAMNLTSVKNTQAPPIITYDITQKDKRFKGTLISKLLDVRNTCLDIFDYKTYSLDQKFISLSSFIVEIILLEKQSKIENLEFIIKNYSGEKTDQKNDSTTISKSFFAFSEMLIEHLNEVGASDSSRFLELSKVAESKNIGRGEILYNDFFNANSHILNNFFKNHIYKNLFPFSEGKDVEEALWLLLCRYAIIKRQLIGIAGHHNALTQEDVIRYLQVFSKVIEHHKHFEPRTIESLRSKKYTTDKLIDALFASAF